MTTSTQSQDQGEQPNSQPLVIDDLPPTSVDPLSLQESAPQPVVLPSP